MKNWNTITTEMSLEEKEVWSLAQLINYGSNGKKISEEKIRKNWSRLTQKLIPARARMYKWLIWGNKS